MAISFSRHKLFENIFNYAMGGLAIVGMRGEWIKVNDSIVKYLGYSKEELYEKTFQDITHKDDLYKDLGAMRALLRGDISNYTIEKRYFHQNGSIVWVRLSVSLVRDDNGNPEYFISEIHDVSQQKSDQEELKILLDLSKEQNNRLSNFADIVTHNLRTHSSNLETLVGFIAEEEATSTACKSENFEYLKESIKNLNDTVSHLSEVAKIKSMNKEEVKPLNLHEYCSKAIYNVSGLAKNIKCKIANNVNPKHEVMAIPAFLDSIILNFLTNALKYRASDRLAEVFLFSEVSEAFVVITFKDNGLGIDMKTHGDDIFKMYKTFHKHKDARGVGLFITKNHIESLGGRIDVKSELGKGTEFSVSLRKAV
ncbi:sensor histidine kinase [Algibacter sp. L1A34]|uniref:sensor histidine kinase n=1 Tax=Algibacter sp. L1A34 TaxID=2686365 RepID=UPI00131B1E12|nr:HAMP domain-containing sensor histidine kinase [Algibacter sp. L1A34]